MDNNKRVPLLIKKKNISVLKRNCFTTDMALLRCMKSPRSVIVKEDVIYQSKPGDFMRGEYPDLTIVNRLNLISNSSRTIASGSETLGNIERTSDDVTKLIGQKNYDTVFSALCSVISQELRIQGILALLTIEKNTKNNSCQTDFIKPINSQKIYTNTSCQTDETCSDVLLRLKQRRKVRKPQLAPYVVVKDLQSSKKIKKVVIEPQYFKDTSKIIRIDESSLEVGFDQRKSESENSNNNVKIEQNELLPIGNSILTENSLQFKDEHIQNNVNETFINNTCSQDSGRDKKGNGKETSFPELRSIVDEDSNISDFSCGNISINSYDNPNLLDNPNALLNDIDKHIQEPKDNQGMLLTVLDGTQVKIQGKPEDLFHIATADILKTLSPVQQTKVMWYQAYIDWKYCLERDEDNNLPLHLAVMNNDLDVLRRQCVVLKSRLESVDVPAHGNLTALQMAITQDYPSCTALLLQHGANPLITDEEQRNAFHLAAEMCPDHLKAIISYCQKDARKILIDNDLWKPELETNSEEEITKYLMSKVCQLYDIQGYSPLMLASKLGNYANVKLFLDLDPSTVNMPMPNCGNTALYVAVASACLEAESKCNKSKVGDQFLKTVEILVKHGADPSVENSSGNTVNHLLNEFNIPELSMLIANTIVSLNYSDNETLSKKDFRGFMLVKDEGGAVNIKEMKSKEPVTSSPKVIENIPVSSTFSLTQNNSICTIIRPISSPSEIRIYPRKINKQDQITSMKFDIPKKNKLQNVVVVPISRASALSKIISIDKQVGTTSKVQSMATLTPIPKVVKVSKIDTKNTINVIGVTTANPNSSAVASSTQPIKLKRTLNAKDLTRGVPIKKQKRDNLD